MRYVNLRVAVGRRPGARIPLRSYADVQNESSWIEFRLLYQLALHFGTTVPRLELSRKVWGGRIAHEALLTVYIMKLRKKIEAKGTDRIRIVTEHGSGYRLECKQKKVVSD